MNANPEHHHAETLNTIITKTSNQVLWTVQNLSEHGVTRFTLKKNVASLRQQTYLKELTLKLGMELVRLGGVAGSTLSAKQTIQRVIKDGSALEKFKEMVTSKT